jgi:predicted nucleotidyltransferase
MESIKATNLRRNLYSVLKKVCATREPIEVTLGSHTAAAIVPREVSDTHARKPLVDLNAVASFCKKYQVKSLALFGSILRKDFTVASDVDVLVELGERHVNVREMFKMVDHLVAVFGRRVDMVERSNLRNIDPVRRKEILATARVIYDEETYDA